MKLSQALPAALFGLGALWLGIGCLGEAEDLDLADDNEVASLPQAYGGPWGSTGTNNLPPPITHERRASVFGATLSNLAVLNTTTHNWDVAINGSTSTLLSTDDGRRVLKYVARCAVDESITLHAQLGTTQFTFPGEGILSTTSDWLTAPIGTPAAEDLFSCLLAHMNARGVQVPIHLSGPSITNTESAGDGFDWEEALWVTDLVQTGSSKVTFNFYVWPLDDLLDCGEYARQVKDRVCGTYSGNCGVTVRTDRSTACTDTPDGWYCSPSSGQSLPAIMTRLKVTDVETMYDNCP